MSVCNLQSALLHSRSPSCNYQNPLDATILNLISNHLTNQLGAGIAQWYSAGLQAGYGLDDWGVRVPAGAGNFSVHHRVQTSSRANTASYPMGIGGFPWG
jgi:hypothetical protein